jgi:multidrug efflux system outer membrane protein
MKIWKNCWMLGACLFLGACKTGPEYQRPVVEVPADWRWKVAEPRDAAPRGAWWEVFQDPVLNELQRRAADANQDLRAAVARVEQARATARLAQSSLFPTLDAQADYGRYRTSGNSPSPVPFPVPSFQQSRWTAGLDLGYEIDLWGKVRRSFEAAGQLVLATEAALQSVRLTLQADVAIHYFTLKTTIAEIAFLERTIEIREDAFTIFQQRNRAGLVGDFEVERARVEVASAHANLAASGQRQAELINALALLCGHPPSALEVAPTTNAVYLPQIAADVPSHLLERRPDVAEAERQMAARCAQIGVAQAAFFPVVRLTAAGGYLSGEVSDLFAWDSRTWSLGPSVSVPLFQGGRLRADLRRAQAAYEEAVALYRQKILVAFKDVEDSLGALRFLSDQVTARQRAAAAATIAARLAFERYQAGAVNFLEVVDAEQARLVNELASLRTVNEQTLATVRLIKSLGGGWEG